MRWCSSAWSASVPRDKGRGGWHGVTYGVVESRWNGSSVGPVRVPLGGRRTWGSLVMDTELREGGAHLGAL